jgi:hypothetical protein
MLRDQLSGVGEQNAMPNDGTRLDAAHGAWRHPCDRLGIVADLDGAVFKLIAVSDLMPGARS